MKDHGMDKFKYGADKYMKLLDEVIDDDVISKCYELARDLEKAWLEKKRIYVCGNGGSGANALHIANDLHYGIGKIGPEDSSPGMKVEALSGNIAIVTCLANDEGYENIYSKQLENKGEKNDILIVLSGSGNSENVVRGIQKANELGMISYAITAFDGGKCARIAHKSIHIKAHDMQIAEDVQLIIGHLCMKWLNNQRRNRTLD